MLHGISVRSGASVTKMVLLWLLYPASLCWIASDGTDEQVVEDMKHCYYDINYSQLCFISYGLYSFHVHNRFGSHKAAI